LTKIKDDAKVYYRHIDKKFFLVYYYNNNNYFINIMKNEKSENILNKKEENMSYYVPKKNEFQIDAQKENMWNNSKSLVEKITREGWQKYIDGLGELAKKLFEEKKKNEILCMDEGLSSVGDEEIGCVGSAGSGILLAKKTGEYLTEDELANYYLGIGFNKIDCFSAHANCGAAKKRFGGTQEEADQKAKKFLQTVAETVNKTFRYHKELTRPEEFHIATVGYYIGTEDFNLKVLIGKNKLPEGFRISRRYFDELSGKADAELAVEIALNHGFCNKFGKDNPFVLVAVADADNPKFSLDKMKAELEEVAKKFGDKVRVDGFTAPSKK